MGRYTLTDFIGAGKIGYVYRAHRNDLLDYTLAVKLTFDRLKDGWDVEIRKVAKLQLIDGVVHFHDLGTETLTHEKSSRMAQYTVWDYIPPGENLGAYLKRIGSVPTSFVLAVLEQVLRVLHACERQGVVRHGDLHSGNILVGESSPAKLDDTLRPRAPIYVSDFGYGATGGTKQPKDDYDGLVNIINEMFSHVQYTTASPTDKQVLRRTRDILTKILNERSDTERRKPLELLQVIADIKRNAQTGGPRPWALVEAQGRAESRDHNSGDSHNVGSFQVAEMIGERWEWWRRLFVPSVPARSKILSLDIPTVVTGPRGCGKTMLLQRLSERLVVECGEVPDLPTSGRFVAFYVNANHIADAFSQFPDGPVAADEGRLICYANLCVLADVLAVQSARMGKAAELPTEALLVNIQRWLVGDIELPLVAGEDRLERCRTILEEIKWKFPGSGGDGLFSGYAELSQHRWLPHFFKLAQSFCPWLGGDPFCSLSMITRRPVSASRCSGFSIVSSCSGRRISL